MKEKIEDLEERKKSAKKRRTELVEKAKKAREEAAEAEERKEKAGTVEEGRKEEASTVEEERKEEAGDFSGDDEEEARNRLQKELDIHTTPLWRTVICDLEAVKAGSEEPLASGMLGSRQMETRCTLLREELHRPMVQLQDGFGLRVEEMKKEVDAACKDLGQSIATLEEDLQDAKEVFEAKKVELEEFKKEKMEEIKRKENDLKEAEDLVEDAQMNLGTVIMTEQTTRSFSEVLRRTMICVKEIATGFPQLLGHLLVKADEEKEKRRPNLAAILKKTKERRGLSDLESETPRRSTEESKRQEVKAMPKDIRQKLDEKEKKKKEKEEMNKEKMDALKEKLEAERAKLGSQRPSEPADGPKAKRDLSKVNPQWLSKSDEGQRKAQKSHGSEDSSRSKFNTCFYCKQ